MFQLFKVFKMTRSTKKIMVSNENSDFRGKVFLKADPKIAEFHHSHYFVVVLRKSPKYLSAPPWFFVKGAPIRCALKLRAPRL